MLYRLLLLGALGLFASFSLAQDNANQLTTADVTKMLKAGVDQKTIKWVIESSDGKQLDGSAAGLQALKKAGASQAILDAVTTKTKKPIAVTAAAAPARTARHTTKLKHGASAGSALRNPATLASTLKKLESLTAETCEEELDTVDGCHANHKTGCSSSENPRYDAYLNYLKNGLPDPSSTAAGDVNGGKPLDAGFFASLEGGIPDTLTSTNHAQHAADLAQQGEGEIVTVVGTIFYTLHGGSETCNCQLTGSEAVVDFHIGVGFADFPLGADVLNKLRAGKKYSSILSKEDQHVLDQASVVVEMTPYYREQFRPGWTLSKVESVTGRQVKVTGQLMIDNVHHKPADDCGLADADTTSCWRASVWEVHPVTSLQVCSVAHCDANSTDWVNLEDM
ncbi:MAG TPA: hypothetical protein VFI38_17670 [Candidatus Acidoferrum sp.]|nr:hypothetical protein [Candidatus Acidoferrum sp.]